MNRLDAIATKVVALGVLFLLAAATLRSLNSAHRHVTRRRLFRNGDCTRSEADVVLDEDFEEYVDWIEGDLTGGWNDGRFYSILWSGDKEASTFLGPFGGGQHHPAKNSTSICFFLDADISNVHVEFDLIELLDKDSLLSRVLPLLEGEKKFFAMIVNGIEVVDSRTIGGSSDAGIRCSRQRTTPLLDMLHHQRRHFVSMDIPSSHWASANENALTLEFVFHRDGGLDNFRLFGCSTFTGGGSLTSSS